MRSPDVGGDDACPFRYMHEALQEDGFTFDTDNSYGAICTTVWDHPPVGASTSDGDDVRVGSLPGRSPEVVEVSERAFAAFKGDGSVVTWGDADFGGNSTEVRELLAADRAV